jgi:hypothetical protein
MRPAQRDPAFLRMAVVAAAGGVVAIVAAIGLPIWLHGRSHAPTPAFALFAAWGVAALGGAYGCLRTYFLSDRVPPRPFGGVPLRVIAGGTPDTVASEGPRDRAA